MAYNNNSRNNNRGGYQGGNGHGQNDGGYNNREYRRSYSNGGSGQRGGNVQGGYQPNSGNAKPNDRRQKATDPAFGGVCNVQTPDGQIHTFFVKIWENENGSLGMKFQNVLDAQQGNGGQNNQPRFNANRGPVQPRNDYGHYDGQNQPNRPQQGAMSRARPIPPAQYNNGPYDDRSPPPAQEWPDNADVNYPDSEETPY